MPIVRRVLTKFPSIDALVAAAAEALRTMSPRTPIDLADRSAVEESGDVWSTITKKQRVACFDVVDARECIEMGIKGLGEARTVDVTSRDVGNASIHVRVTSGPGVPTELVATLEGFDDERVRTASDVVNAAF